MSKRKIKSGSHITFDLANMSIQTLVDEFGEDLSEIVPMLHEASTVGIRVIKANKKTLHVQQDSNDEEWSLKREYLVNINVLGQKPEFQLESQNTVLTRQFDGTIRFSCGDTIDQKEVSALKKFLNKYC